MSIWLVLFLLLAGCGDNDAGTTTTPAPGLSAAELAAQGEAAFVAKIGRAHV